jgi:hypothetical protein
VYMVSDNHETGWVSASLVRDAGDISQVSIRDDSTTVRSARPTLTSAEIAHGARAYLTAVSATNIPESPYSRYVVPCFELAKRLGDWVSCRMERAYCDYFPAIAGSPTICTDRPHPDHIFKLTVTGKDWSHFDGQCILVKGYLQIDKGVLKIEASRHSKIYQCD